MEWFYYLIVINTVSFVMMSIDKSNARQRKRRIRERTLFITAFLGGSIGMYLGMKLFRHKTKHKSFSYGIPCIILAQIILTIYINILN